MKYSLKIDWWIKLLFYFSIVITIGPMIAIPQDEMIFYLLAVLPINIFLLWILFGSYYELKDDLLYLRIGPIFRRIKYENIKSLSYKRNWSSSMAMTMDRIYIEIHNKTMLKTDVQIGPTDKEEFMDDLKRRCRNLD